MAGVVSNPLFNKYLIIHAFMPEVLHGTEHVTHWNVRNRFSQSVNGLVSYHPCFFASNHVPLACVMFFQVDLIP